MPKVNLVLLLVLVVMMSAIGFDYFMERRKKVSAIEFDYFIEKRKKESAVVREVEDSKIVVVVMKDGIFYVLDGREVSIESLSPLVIRHRDNVFRKDGEDVNFWYP